MKQNQLTSQVDFAGDGKYDSPGIPIFFFSSFWPTIITGYSAQYCTYVIQELKEKKIVGDLVAHKYMVLYSMMFSASLTFTIQT